MLPLWIIDLTESSVRRSRFEELLRQTKYVFFSHSDSESGPQVTDEEFRWMYTHYDDLPQKERIPWDLSETTDEEAKEYSEKIYAFQNDLVRDGQQYIKMVRHSSLRAYTSLNICVLGDASEAFTQRFFASVALFLQKEKGRMLANHVHQGMSIFGALFVPSDINSDDVENRERVLRTLMEVDVQHQISTVRGYDHIILFQDVQNRFEKYYNLLDSVGQAEYFYQCMVHLFYACNTQHPLISGVAAADSFYLSLGVASVVFDDRHQDCQVSCDVSNRLMDAFFAPAKNEELADAEQIRKKRVFLPAGEIDLLRVLKTFVPKPIDLDVKMPDPMPDPLSDYADKHLKRRYFNEYLSRYLAEFRRLMNDEVERSTRGELELVHNTFNRSLNHLQSFQFPEALKRFLDLCNADDGGLCLLESQLKNLQEQAGLNKKRIPDYVQSHIWENVFQRVDKSMLDDFLDYHAAYSQDISSRSGSRYSEEMKSDAVDDMCNHMKQETPILSRIVRAFALGVVCVLAALPVLNLLSPMFINLGNIRKTAVVWSVIVFMMPALWEIFSTVRYLVKRRRKERKLRTFYLHDAYARVANRIMAEAGNFYDKVMQLCELYLKRSETIRKEIHSFPEPEEGRGELPETRFNQPLLGGDFCGHTILTREALEPKRIYISYRPKLVETLQPEDFFSLVHMFKEDFYDLFDGIRIPEKHPFVLEKETGTIRPLSAEEAGKAQQEDWEKIRNKFKTALPELIKHELVPLEHPSASSMVRQYFNRTHKTTILKPFYQFAAPNGEFITSADLEYVDVKTVDDSIKMPDDIIFPEDTIFQVEPGGEDDESREAEELYKKYIFLTRWVSFESLALNRILPLEDFDLEEQKRQFNEESRKGTKRLQKDRVIPKEEEGYVIPTSSALLWALSDGDNSVAWLKLFHASALVQARKMSDIIYNKLTTKD